MGRIRAFRQYKKMKDKKQREEISIKVLLKYANNIIATLREPFLVLDNNLQVISANRVFYTAFKVTKKETIGWRLSHLGNRQWNIPKLLQLLKETMAADKVVKDYEVEHKFERIGQRVMLLNVRQLRVARHVAAIIAGRIRKEKEKVVEEKLILLAIEDITERQRLQETLKESEERYRRAFETSKDGLLLVHKTEGQILNANLSAWELLGYSEEEFLKKKLWGIGVTKDHKDFQQTVSRLERNGVIHYEDALVKPKKGPPIDTEVFLVNRAKVLQCNIRDTSIRKRAEEALKESEARFKAIFNESTDGMFLAEGGTRRFSMCNSNLCQMLGYTEGELKGMAINDIHPQKDLPFVIGQFERQAKGELKLAAGLAVKRKDGSIFYADVNASPITLAGKKYLVESFRDITESKSLQDELKKKMQDLERFSKFSVNRELKMEELEEKVKELEEKIKSR
jgi:PAS domain S-box-containing protein